MSLVSSHTSLQICFYAQFFIPHCSPPLSESPCCSPATGDSRQGIATNKLVIELRCPPAFLATGRPTDRLANRNESIRFLCLHNHCHRETPKRSMSLLQRWLPLNSVRRSQPPRHFNCLSLPTRTRKAFRSPILRQPARCNCQRQRRFRLAWSYQGQSLVGQSRADKSLADQRHPISLCPA